MTNRIMFVGILALCLSGAWGAKLVQCATPTKEAIVKVVSSGNPEDVAVLLNSGIDVNQRVTERDATLLILAAASNPNEEVIYFLITAGARLNEKDNLGNSALVYAVLKNKNTKITNTLIQAGANVDESLRKLEDLSGQQVTNGNVSINYLSLFSKKYNKDLNGNELTVENVNELTTLKNDYPKLSNLFPYAEHSVRNLNPIDSLPLDLWSEGGVLTQGAFRLRIIQNQGLNFSRSSAGPSELTFITTIPNQTGAIGEDVDPKRGLYMSTNGVDRINICENYIKFKQTETNERNFIGLGIQPRKRTPNEGGSDKNPQNIIGIWQEWDKDKVSFGLHDRGFIHKQAIIGWGEWADNPLIFQFSDSNGDANDLAKLFPNGSFWLQGHITQNSDKRLKKNITPISDAMEKILALTGVEFTWIKTGKPDVGVIAQDVEKVFPELVTTQDDGFKAVSYPNLIAPLIEAYKTIHILYQDQQKLIEQQQKALEELRSDLKTNLELLQILNTEGVEFNRKIESDKKKHQSLRYMINSQIQLAIFDGFNVAELIKAPLLSAHYSKLKEYFSDYPSICNRGIPWKLDKTGTQINAALHADCE